MALAFISASNLVSKVILESSLPICGTHQSNSGNDENFEGVSLICKKLCSTTACLWSHHRSGKTWINRLWIFDQKDKSGTQYNSQALCLKEMVWLFCKSKQFPEIHTQFVPSEELHTRNPETWYPCRRKMRKYLDIIWPSNKFCCLRIWGIISAYKNRAFRKQQHIHQSLLNASHGASWPSSLRICEHHACDDHHKSWKYGM